MRRNNLLIRIGFTAILGFLGLPNNIGAQDAAKLEITEFPLGVAFGFKYNGEVFMPHIRELGVNQTKLYLYWQQVEPKRGEYNWQIIDNFLQQLDNESKVLIAVYSSSTWGAKAGLYKGGSIPLNMDDYYNFIVKLVKHCQGKVKYWQNDCEPDGDYWQGGTKAEYVATLKVFYKAVKAADPQASVIVGGHSGAFSKQGLPQRQEFFDYVLAEGKDYFDLFDLRLYNNVDTIPQRVAWFRNRMKDFGFQKPIVCTEYGGPMPSQFPEAEPFYAEFRKLEETHGRKKAMLLLKEKIEKNRASLPNPIKMFLENTRPDLDEKRHRIHCRDIVSRTIVALSVGVKKLWLWNLVNDPHLVFGKFRLMDSKFTQRYPAFYAYQRMASKLKGIKSIRRITTKKEDLYLFGIEREKRSNLYVLWQKRSLFEGENQPKIPFEFKFEEKSEGQVKIMDVFGEEWTGEIKQNILKLDINDTPLFIEGL